MDLGLRDRVAMVTGGASGIGAAIACELAGEGCDIAVVDVRGGGAAAEVVRAVEAAGRRAWVREADVADFALAERVVGEAAAEFGRLDLLVCCAGITDDGMSWKLTEAQWDRVLDVNLKGFFNYARAAGALMKERRAGRIVAIASINGLRGKAGQANYAASKGGMIALGKTLARELGRYGVTVNLLAPGMVRTAMSRALPADVVARSLDETVLGQLAEPADCAALVTFLCSDRAARITGQVVKVDGGQYL
jgi:3-oxoacyl-[acyl-carrier protein] reductase